MNLIKKTPLYKSEFLSNRYNCNVFLKREDLQNKFGKSIIMIVM